jgi:predicted secreted protein
MGKLNASLVQLYADGVVIAAQRGFTLNLEQDLPDTTNKESGGWAEHLNGLRNSSVDITALFSTTGVSAGELLDYIIDRSSLLLAIVGGIAFPLVAEVDVANSKIDAPLEDALALSGSLKIDGPLYQLKGTAAALVTDPDAGTTDYDTLTLSGLAITSAVNAAGNAFCKSNSFAITSGDVVKVPVFFTWVSGEYPTVELCEVGGGAAAISNVATLVAGLNIITLTATDTHTACICFRNTAAASWAISPVYAFKYVAS